MKFLFPDEYYRLMQMQIEQSHQFINKANPTTIRTKSKSYIDKQ